MDALSRLYRTKPVGLTDQPDFLNLVLAGRTPLAPLELLRGLREIESELGRERRVPNGPRTIDIDILDYDGAVLVTHDLVLPHPRMHERAFVLVPLLEVAPDWVHPVSRRTAVELLRQVRADGGADAVVSADPVDELLAESEG